MSSTYFAPPENLALPHGSSSWDYARVEEPNSEMASSKVKKLYPNTKYILMTPSGVCSISTELYACISLFSSKKLIQLLLPNEIYKDSLQLFAHMKNIHDLKIVFYDPLNSIDILNLVEKSGPCIFFVETCTNPSSYMVDPELYLKIKTINSQVITVVDNSWIGPVLFNPMEHGADILVESTSKCLSGGAIISGIVITNYKKYYEACKSHIVANGLHVSPFDSWYLCQMIDTIYYRTSEASKKCIKIIQKLEQEEFISFIHPILQNHPSHSMVKKYLSGVPNVVWVHITGIAKDEVKKYLLNSSILLAPSYGKSHTIVDPGVKQGKTEMDTFFRLSIGYVDNTKSTIETLLGLRDLL